MNLRPVLCVSPDSNLDHRAKLKLRFMVGGAWGAMVGMPSGHYTLDMQSAKDRLTASKVTRFDLIALRGVRPLFVRLGGECN